MVSVSLLGFLLCTSLMAGFLDAVVGGGGLITIPTLLLALPTQSWPAISGTNKLQAFVGTSVAASQFMRARMLHWRDVVGPVMSSMMGAAAGVMATFYLAGRFEVWLKPAMLMVMVAMLGWTLFKPDAGQLHAPKRALSTQRRLACVIAFCLGFYDGLFGPGTGSILIFLFVALLGFDFLRASALAKSVNWASNLASVALFLYKGTWLPQVAMVMALGNALGGYLGARTALAKGSRWVRLLFILVVSALLVKLGWSLLPIQRSR